MEDLADQLQTGRISEDLDAALDYLLEEADDGNGRGFDHLRHHITPDVYIKLSILRQLLCIRPAHPQLPDSITDAIDCVLRYDQSRRQHVDINELQYHPVPGSSGAKISIWKGDIRDLANATAIVNAANSQLLGCFQPDHKCIDNVIHAEAGPRLRQTCFEIMSKQRHLEPEGQAKVTPGYNLLAKYVIHTVGPQIKRGASPLEREAALLEKCYWSCLEATEKLPRNEDGSKSIVFCGISTGLFGFPLELASEIAVSTVLRYFGERNSSVTHVVFDTFSKRDLLQYEKVLQASGLFDDTQFTTQPPETLPDKRVALARKLFQEADFLILTAGAGLSADTGLDYTSIEFFRQNLPGFLRYGFRRLYDVFGFDEWPSPVARWSYLINHLRMVRDYRSAQIYEDLRELVLSRFAGTAIDGGEERYFVRTTNADGFFVKHGFPASRISTPQGQYAYVQCFAKCRPDAVFPSQPYVDEAFPHLDPETQHLPPAFKVPVCPYCSSDLVLCVRGGDYFNDSAFRKQERKYKELVNRLAKDEGTKVLVLELGVGMNTPSVLRWHNEKIVRSAKGNFGLVRMGLGPAGYAPLDLEGEGVAVGLEGGLGHLLGLL
jgi:O-acetyl-ADP-ribose deacetylase (regulator of RNase III)/NAD-dependent SIR2 family protein deacetylase